MKLTFVDAGVLITAACGSDPARALSILDDEERVFAASPFLRLEVIPQATFNKRRQEVEFYEAFFAAATVWVDDLPAIVTAAEREAASYRVSAMDGLHVPARSPGRRSGTGDDGEADQVDPPRTSSQDRVHLPGRSPLTAPAQSQPAAARAE